MLIYSQFHNWPLTHTLQGTWCIHSPLCINAFRDRLSASAVLQLLTYIFCYAISFNAFAARKYVLC